MILILTVLSIVFAVGLIVFAILEMCDVFLGKIGIYLMAGCGINAVIANILARILLL